MRTKEPISQSVTQFSTVVDTWTRRVDIVPEMAKKSPRSGRRDASDEDANKRSIRANVPPEIATAWRVTCQNHGMGLNEAMERLMRWFTAQDRTTQQFFLDVVPPELRLPVASHVVGSILDTVIRSFDVQVVPASKIGGQEIDRLREVARLYHVTLPATRNPDGSIEEVTRTYERVDEPKTGGESQHGKQDSPKGQRANGNRGAA